MVYLFFVSIKFEHVLIAFVVKLYGQKLIDSLKLKNLKFNLISVVLKD